MNALTLRGLPLALVVSLALVVPAGGAAQPEPTVPVETPAPAPAPAEPPGISEPARAAKAAALERQIRKYRARVRHWRRVMGRPGRPAPPLRSSSVEELTALRDAWRERARRVQARAKRPPNRAAWLCIHKHEGAWDDPHAPYYGGLQMDLSFQRAYGRYLLRRKGTADRWRPYEQMWTAERALRAGRGFHPWPNTARRCGLL